jgi:hypothetical protein
VAIAVSTANRCSGRFVFVGAFAFIQKITTAIFLNAAVSPA